MPRVIFYFEIVGVVANYKSRDYENPSWQEFLKPSSLQREMFYWRTIMADLVDAERSFGKHGEGGTVYRSGRRHHISGTLEASLRSFIAGHNLNW